MRIGAKKRPFYRVVAVDERSKRTGAYIELLGTYNPLTEPKEIKLKQDRIDHWTKQGAQMSDGFLRIIGKAPQRPPRKPKKEKKAEPAPAQPAQTPAAEETPQEIPAEETAPAETVAEETQQEETSQEASPEAQPESETSADTSEVKSEVSSNVDTSEVEQVDEPTPKEEK